MKDTTRLLAMMKDAEDHHTAFRAEALRLLRALRPFRPGMPIYLEQKYIDDVREFLYKHDGTGTP